MFQELIDLWKAKSHKYTHKKRVYVKGKPSWRYYYKEHHGGGVTKVDELHVGEAFKVNYKGKEGHFHVQEIKGDKVKVVHDETGKETTLTRAELKAVLSSTHSQALKENVKKKEQSLKEAQSGGKMLQVNAKRRLEQARKQLGEEAPKKEAKDVITEDFKKLDIIEKLHAVGSSILTQNQIELLDELCRHDEVSTEELADDTGKSKRSISSTASSINKRYEKVNEHFTLVDIDQSDRETYLQLDQEELEGWLNDTYEQANKKPEKQEPAKEAKKDFEDFTLTKHTQTKDGALNVLTVDHLASKASPSLKKFYHKKARELGGLISNNPQTPFIFAFPDKDKALEFANYIENDLTHKDKTSQVKQAISDVLSDFDTELTSLVAQDYGHIDDVEEYRDTKEDSMPLLFVYERVYKYAKNKALDKVSAERPSGYIQITPDGISSKVNFIREDNWGELDTEKNQSLKPQIQTALNKKANELLNKPEKQESESVAKTPLTYEEMNSDEKHFFTEIFNYGESTALKGKSEFKLSKYEEAIKDNEEAFKSLVKKKFFIINYSSGFAKLPKDFDVEKMRIAIQQESLTRTYQSATPMQKEALQTMAKYFKKHDRKESMSYSALTDNSKKLDRLSLSKLKSLLSSLEEWDYEEQDDGLGFIDHHDMSGEVSLKDPALRPELKNMIIDTILGQQETAKEAKDNKGAK